MSYLKPTSPSLNSGDPLYPNLKAVWAFYEGSGTIIEEFVNSLDGSVDYPTDYTWSSDGTVGNYINCNASGASGNNISVPTDSGGSVLDTMTFTVSILVNFDPSAHAGSPVSRFSTNGWDLFTNLVGAGNILGQIRPGFGGNNPREDGAGDNTWHLVTLSHDGSSGESKIYLDGTLVDTRTQFDSGPGGLMEFGAYTTGQEYVGKIGGSWFWDVVLGDSLVGTHAADPWGVLAAAPPAGDEIVRRHRVVAPPKSPLPKSSRAHSFRKPVRFHFTPPDTAGSPIACRGHRVSTSKTPPRNALRGTVKRRHGFAPDQSIPRLLRPKRVAKPKGWPHPSQIKGRAKKTGGRVLLPGFEFYEIYEQGYRVADTSLDLYELFVGLNESPNLDGAPIATSATLPFSWTPPTPAPGTGPLVLHVVVRKKNQYGLVSFNIYESLIQVASGAEVFGPVSPPFDPKVYDGTTQLYLRVIAKYNVSEDRHPADTWVVFATVGGVPNPNVDVPAYSGAMSTTGTESALGVDIGPYSSGDLVYVVVGTRRASDGVSAYAAPVTHVVAPATTLPDGQVFGGNTYEEH